MELYESEATKDIQQGFVKNMMIGIVVILLTILLISYTINIFQRQLEVMATTDKLTGIGNRQTFDDNLSQAIKRFRRKPSPASLLLLDVDNFKRINDTKGHITGDGVIRNLAACISAQIRESDLICRWGGEEFTVLMTDCKLDGAVKLGEKICTVIQDARFIEDDPDFQITASIGVTQFREGDDEKSLLSRADRAMYKAKDMGRNRTESV